MSRLRDCSKPAFPRPTSPQKSHRLQGEIQLREAGWSEGPLLPTHRVPKRGWLSTPRRWKQVIQLCTTASVSVNGNVEGVSSCCGLGRVG